MLLEQTYTRELKMIPVSRSKKIQNFIDENELTHVLDEADKYIKKIFGNTGKSEQIIDGKLYVFIKVTTVNECIEKIQEFDNVWWLEQPSKIHNILNFDARVA